MWRLITSYNQNIQLGSTSPQYHFFLTTMDCMCSCCSGVGPNGKAVLYTIANNGGCSDKWGKILQISAREVDKELKRALKYKFERDVPDPLETKYKYWDEGFW